MGYVRGGGWMGWGGGGVVAGGEGVCKKRDPGSQDPNILTVWCPVSCVRCHMSGAMCQDLFSLFSSSSFFGNSLGLVVGGSVINGAYLIKFLLNSHPTKPPINVFWSPENPWLSLHLFLQ